MVKKCLPCKKALSPMKGTQIHEALDDLDNGWEVIENHHLHKVFKFKNFKDALLFTNHVGLIAEKEGHHPQIILKWGEVTIDLFTHEIGGLSMSDFAIASKIETNYLLC
jgi:4a-hydroxytetrahydrobiopterin dehydratase